MEVYKIGWDRIQYHDTVCLIEWVHVRMQLMYNVLSLQFCVYHLPRA